MHATTKGRRAIIVDGIVACLRTAAAAVMTQVRTYRGTRVFAIVLEYSYSYSFITDRFTSHLDETTKASSVHDLG